MQSKQSPKINPTREGVSECSPQHSVAANAAAAAAAAAVAAWHMRGARVLRGLAATLSMCTHACGVVYLVRCGAEQCGVVLVKCEEAGHRQIILG